MASEFLRAYGAILIGATVGLILVAMGLFGKDQGVLMAGISAVSAALGLHLGGHTGLVPTKTADAVAHIEEMGGKVKIPKKVAEVTDTVTGKP